MSRRTRGLRDGHVRSCFQQAYIGAVRPQTMDAKSGNVSVAYQVIGEGSIDLVLVPGFVSHVELAWEEPNLARVLTRLASFSRLIIFDKRGTGMSDPMTAAPWSEFTTCSKSARTAEKVGMRLVDVVGDGCHYRNPGVGRRFAQVRCSWPRDPWSSGRKS